jgi:hypothetical protein
LPNDFQLKPYLEFLFVSITHYNQYWYNEIVRRDMFSLLQKNMDGMLR